MDEYITDEFLKKLDEASKDERKELRRKIAIEIFEGEKGEISPKEISKLLGISENQVIRYLGMKRLENYKKTIGIPISSEKIRRVNIEIGIPKGRLTDSKVDRLVLARNERIKTLSDSGLSVEEVAEIEHLTISQAKEIYMSLGLPIYTLSELKNIKKVRKEKERAERKVASRKRRNRRRREKRTGERQKGKVEIDKKPEINSFKDLIEKMRELLQQGKSGLAINLGRSFSNSTILTPEEREKLDSSLKELESIREAYRRVQEKEEVIEK